jgi:hypothetical protein
MVQVWRDLQDAHPGLPVRHAGEPGGGAVRAGDAGGPIQAHVPAEQGALDRAVGALLPPGRLPPPHPQARPGRARPRRHARARTGRRGRREVHSFLLGRQGLEHVPCNEEGKHIILLFQNDMREFSCRRVSRMSDYYY